MVLGWLQQQQNPEVLWQLQVLGQIDSLLYEKKMCMPALWGGEGNTVLELHCHLVPTTSPML